MDQHTITADGLAALRREVEELEGDGRRRIAERIKTAREWGDLKENAEYHDAKNDQAMLETKILRLREKLATAVVVEAGTGEDGVVAFGSTVTVADDGGKESTYVLVGADEADASTGRISSQTPVAQALMGKRAGESAEIHTPRGTRTLRVVSVS